MNTFRIQCIHLYLYIFLACFMVQSFWLAKGIVPSGFNRMLLFVLFILNSTQDNTQLASKKYSSFFSEHSTMKQKARLEIVLWPEKRHFHIIHLSKPQDSQSCKIKLFGSIDIGFRFWKLCYYLKLLP